MSLVQARCMELLQVALGYKCDKICAFMFEEIEQNFELEMQACVKL